MLSLEVVDIAAVLIKQTGRGVTITRKQGELVILIAGFSPMTVQGASDLLFRLLAK